MRPELLAVRAVNQYRNRDILAYLGLRYYLENQCARRDRWITDIATQLVITRTSPSYFRSIHFKDFSNNNLEHRYIHIPSPNEALAETALINECSKHKAFESLPSVYSYRFPDKNSKEGVYQRYFSGLKKRHESLTDYCKNSNSTIIQYTDIKKFYPHITKELALQVWQKVCEKSGIEFKYRELGEKILSDHASTSSDANNGKGLLTGPMISHLIANLVLHDVDEKMSAEMPNQYWRYVDDVILTGDKQKVTNGRKLLESLLIIQNFYSFFENRPMGDFIEHLIIDPFEEGEEIRMESDSDGDCFPKMKKVYEKTMELIEDSVSHLQKSKKYYIIYSFI